MLMVDPILFLVHKDELERFAQVWRKALRDYHRDAIDCVDHAALEKKKNLSEKAMKDENPLSIRTHALHCLLRSYALDGPQLCAINHTVYAGVTMLATSGAFGRSLLLERHGQCR